MRIEASVVIEVPIREVFAYAANPCSWPEWMTGVSAIQGQSARAPDVGETFDQEDRSVGNRRPVRWEVIEHEPPRVLSCRRIAGAAPAVIRQVFKCIDGPTKLRMSVEGEATGPFTTGPTIERAITAQLEGDLQRHKELLEGQHAEINAGALARED